MKENIFIESIINASPDIIYIYDIEDKKNVYVNEGMYTNLGYTDAEIKQMEGRVLQLLMHPEDYETYRHHIFPGYFKAKDKEILNNEFRMKDKQGNWHWLSCKESVFLRKPDGTPKQIFGITNDITERKKAEDKIRESEMKYRTLMKQAGDYILLFSATGQLLEANLNAMKMLGYSNEEYKEMSLKDLFFAEDIMQSPLRFDLLNKGESTINRRRLKRKGGEALETEIHAKRLSDGNYLGVARDISERIKSEKLLRESEEKYRTLVEHASDGIVMTDIKGRCIDANRTICNMLGYTKEELNNRDLFEILVINKGDVPFRFNEILAGKTVLQERNVIKKNGGILSVELNSKLLPDDRILVIIRDISERKHIEDALRKSNERNDIVAKATNDAIWDWDLQTGKVFRSKEGLKKVYGYDDNAPIELVTEWSRQVHPDDREMMDKLIEKINQSPDQNTFSVEYRFLRQDDGRYVYVFDRGYIIRNEHGKAIRMIGAAQDITERKKAEEKILKSEEQYKDLVDNITDIICTHDLDGRILSANRAGEKLLEYKFNPDGNLNIKDILTDDTKDNFNHYIAEIKKKGYAQGLMKIKTSTGKIRIWEYNNSMKTTSEEPAVVRGYARDITERKKTEYLIKKQKEQYDELVKNIPVGVYKFRMKQDGSMSFDYVSPKLCEMIGIEEEDAYRDIMNAFKVIHKDDFGGFIQLIKESFITKRNFLWEGRAVFDDGLKWMRIQSIPKVLEDGDILWDGVIADITENKKAEAALRESEETFSKIFYLNPSVCSINDLHNHKFIDVNEAFIKYFGYKKEEIIGKTSGELGILNPEVRNKILSKMDGNGVVFNEEAKVKTKSGESKDVLISTSNIYIGEKEYAYTVSNDITERKKAEERIRINEARLTKAQQIGKLGYWQQELNNNMIWGSEEARKIYGFSPVAGELAKETVAACIPDIERVRQAAIDLIKQDKKYDIEFQINPADGSPAKYISALAEIEKDEQGEPFRIMGVLKDITEYKLAEAALKKSESHYRMLIDQAADGIFLSDAQGNYKDVNIAGCNMLGYSYEEMMCMNITEVVVQEEIPKIDLEVAKLKGGSIVLSEWRFKHKNGSLFPGELIGRMLTDGSIQAIVRDITERKKAEEKLEENEEKFRGLVEQSITGIYIIQGEDFTYVNPRFAQIFGYSQEEMLFTIKAIDIVYEPDKKLVRGTVESRLQGKAVSSNYRFRGKKKDGTVIHVEVFGARVIQGGQPVTIGTLLDITERQRAEEEIKRTNEQLRQLTAHLQKIREEERKRIGREIHDELGQQLTAIKMDVAWIDKKTPGETTAIKSKLRNIIGLLDGSNQSIKRILSELRPTALEHQGLLEVLEWQGWQFTESTGIPVEFTTAETTVKLPEEIATCIFRVYQESLTNIIRYAQATKVSTVINISDNVIIVTIEDDGKGFNTADLQNKKSFGIMGMKERVQSLNGKFELISSPGKGTKIIISVPMST